MLEQYRGNYFTADSASDYIDINAIVSGCKALAESSTGFNGISEKIYSAGDCCDAKALSVEGETLTDYIYEQGEIIEDFGPSITELANQIMNRAYEAYNRIQSQLNDDAYNRECDYVNQLNNRR